MSQRGRLDQMAEEWRNQVKATVTKTTPQPPVPDTRDGVDWLVINVLFWVVCCAVGYLIGKYA